MKYSKLSTFKIKKILACFSDELTAVQTAKQLRFNRNTVDRFFDVFRKIIAEYQEEQKTKFRGQVEIDESYFGAKYRGAPEGRSSAQKIPVIGILKRKGKVYTQIIPNAQKKTLQPIIERLVARSRSNVFTDQWRSYDGLVLSGYKHYRINHSKEFVRNHNHINGIESFWSYVKRKMRKHNGIKRDKFYWYLKESEFRFNNRGQDLTKLLTKLLKQRKIF